MIASSVASSVAVSEEQATITPISQTCRRCETEKLLLDFPADNKRRLGRLSYCQECFSLMRAEQGEGGEKAKSQPKGDALMQAWSKNPVSDETLALRNQSAYKKQRNVGKRTCKFRGCITPVRYRSPYAPFCERHGTPDKRDQAKLASSH